MSDISTFLPVGSVIPFAGKDPDSLHDQGWLTCDGRILDKTAYPDLFAAISNFWGGSESGTTFSVPDLRGQFLRTRTSDVSKDPDQDLRTPMGTGLASDVGSRQTYGTAPASTAFKATISNLKRDSASYIEGCMDRPAKVGSGSSTAKVSSGGDKETRPDNKYVYYLIKWTPTASNAPVEVPIGGLAAMAGIDDDGLDDNWLVCDGDSLSPRGVFQRLYDVIGYAHGEVEVQDSDNEYVLPNYLGYFLRGVTAGTGTDPDADLRESPYQPSGAEPSGNAGNQVGSMQKWATAMPVKADFETTYDTQPSGDAGKSTNGTSRTLYTYKSNTSVQNVTEDGGDSESRPANIRVKWYIRYL